MKLQFVRRKQQTRGYDRLRSAGAKYLFNLRIHSQERMPSALYFKYAFRLAPTIKKYTMHAFNLFFISLQSKFSLNFNFFESNVFQNFNFYLYFLLYVLLMMHKYIKEKKNI